MKKKILFCAIGLILLLTGCNTKKDDNKVSVIGGLNTVIEFNSNADTDITKIKYKIVNNSNNNFEINTIVFEVNMKDKTVETVKKELNYTVKIGETYEVEAEANVNPKQVDNISYFTE